MESGEKKAPASPDEEEHRFSLRQILLEAESEKRESQFGRQLVDSAEIDKMFSKRKRKKRAAK